MAKSGPTTIYRPGPDGTFVAVETVRVERRAKTGPMTLRDAKIMFGRAQEWPRCGQDFPGDEREVECLRVLSEHGIEP